jgi:hypothetical protein
MRPSAFDKVLAASQAQAYSQGVQPEQEFLNKYNFIIRVDS